MNTASPAWSLRTLPHGHMGDALLPLFELVFGHRPRPEAWAWKYADERSFHVVCEAPGDGVVGHAAVQFAGSLPDGSWLGQVGDVMVHPRHRGQLANGVFARMLDELAVQATARGYGLCFGFPGERPALLGLRLGIYAELGRPSELTVLPGAEGGWRKWLSPVHCTSADAFRAQLRADGGVQTRCGRTGAYMAWRYLDGAMTYRFASVGGWLTDKAWAVLRPMDDGSLLLVDWWGRKPVTEGGLRQLAEGFGAPVRCWTHALTGPLSTASQPSPFVTIRLAKMPVKPHGAVWFDTCLPGDVDVY
jgi:hypothetical protein